MAFSPLKEIYPLCMQELLFSVKLIPLDLPDQLCILEHNMP